LAKIKRDYGITLNEGNYQAIILEELDSPPSLLDYFRKYMKKGEITLEWGCLMFLLIKADIEGDVQAVERSCKSLKKYPANYFIEFVMAELELQYYGNIFEAKDKLFKALELKSDDGTCYHNLGLIYSLPGAFNKALGHYEKAVLYSRDSIEPSELKASSLYDMAVIKINIEQNYSTAKRFLKETLKENPDYDLARETLRKLRWER